jgi:hypothetical protein
VAARRLLPEAAYDFWARDGRDGEEGPRRESIAAARSDKATWPVRHAYQRSAITVEWAVNERKVLALLRQSATRETK